MNNEIWTPSQSPLVFSEKADKKGIMMYGIMMPEGEISRNNVQYDWDSVKENKGNLINRPVMYNHEIDGMGAISIGHYTASEVMTVDKAISHPKYKILKGEIEKLNYPSKKELWLYEADLDPSEEKYINKIRRGDLRHVSIQLKAKDTEEKFDKNNNFYTYAYVGDIIEGSVVPTPGFLQTCAVLAEKYGGQKMDVTKETIEVDGKYYKEVEIPHVEKLFLNNKKDINSIRQDINTIKEQLEDKKMPENKDAKAPETKIEETVKVPEQKIDEETKKDHDPTPATDVTKDVEKDHVESAEEDEDTKKESSEEDEDTKKESSEEDEDTKKEAVDDEDEDMNKESTDEKPDAEKEEDDLNNMEKIVTVLETMKEKIDSLNSRIESLEAPEDEKKEAVEDDEEPSAKESLSMSKALFTEKVENKKEEFKKAVSSFMRS